MNREPYRGTGRTMSLLFGCCLIVIAIVLAGVGYEQSFVVRASRSQDVVEAARAELEKAIANEKANRTKEAGLAVDAALAKYNAAVEAASGGGKGTPGKVQTPAGPTPTITPETEPNNTSGTAQVLSSTENCFIVQGAVTPSADLDFYRVDNVPAGARAWFYTDTGGTLVAGTRDSFIDVLAADGTTSIESDDDDGTGNGGDGTVETGFASSIAGRTLTTGGTYFFRVRGFGTFPGSDVVNPYRMFLVITNIAATAEVEPNGTFGTANSLVTATQPTGIRSGTISSSGEVDFYSVEATAGNILFISMDGDPGRTGTNTLGGVVTLLAPDGTTTLIQANSGFASATNSEAFDFNISTTGTYFVRVAGFSTESGLNYHIMVSACRGASGGSCVLTCPANITRSNDPNQCGAVVTYPAPTPSGTCGTVTCSPASGSFFPKGTTTVTCGAAGLRPFGQAPAVCTPQTITQSSSQSIVSNNSVSCNAGGIHVENSYYRAFTLSSFGITNQFDIASVDIGVEVANAGGTAPTPGKPSISANTKGKVFAPGATTQPITIKLYTSSMPFPTGFPGSLTQIGITNTTVNDAANTVVNIPVTGSAPAGSQLVVEVLTPDGTAAGNSFFIGSNASAETGPSYLRAPLCGVTTPTATAAIGFAFMHIVMNVTGCQQVAGGGPTCSFTVRVNDTQFPTITCPANVTRSNDPNQCGAVVTYPPPTVSDNCPGFSNGPACSPASGSFFPKGTTTVTCGVSDSSVLESSCTFTVRVNDTQPPTIICPATINTAAAVSCPIAVSKVVTFSNPPATDNCPGVTVACNPPSGATFPVGCTTVTCTATDTSGNTATCTFQICVFSFCLQDETNPGNVVLANTQTGDYIYCCNGVFVASGRGVVTLRGCQGTIEDNKGDRKVELRFDTSAAGNRGKGSSTLKIGQVIRCQITDQDMSNNTCACSTQPPSGQLRK